MNILDRYITRELIGPFLFGVCAFTSIFIASDVLFQLARLFMDGTIDFVTGVKLFLLNLPRIVVLTFPMSMLLGTLLAYSRLSEKSEVVAMKASGLSQRRIAVPALCFALLVSGITLLLNETVVPHTNKAVQEIMRKVYGEAPRRQRNVVLKDLIEGKLVKLVFAEEFDGERGELTNVTVQEFRGGKLARMTNAAKAFWKEGLWKFLNGTAYTILEDGRVLAAKFKTQETHIVTEPKDIAARERSPDEMSISELKAHVALVREQGGNANPLLVQLYLKLAIPFASLVFALVGAPLGIHSHRSATSVGFGMSVIIIFIYYVIMGISTAFGQRGAISPFLGAWSQNLLLGGAGVWMVIKGV